MHWRHKQLFSAILLAIFFTTFLPHPLMAEKPAVSLEQAIQTAKGFFPIPPGYSDFNSEFMSNVNGESWMLRWRAPEPETGYLEVMVDAKSGECINMNQWRTEQPGNGMDKALSEAQARKIAESQLKRLLPQKASSLRLVTKPNLISLNGGQRSYYFIWERYENNIPVLGNGVTMEIDCQHRDIRSYNREWSDLPLDKTSKAISLEQAIKVFQEQELLKLEYKAPRDVRTLGSKIKDKPRLVYVINHPSNGTINAITGQPQVLKNGQWEEVAGGRYGNMKNMAGGMGAADSGSSLSPEEIKELEKNSRFIGQEEAVRQVKKWLAIPANAVLSNSSLGRDWQYQERRIWNLNWNVPATGPDEGRNLNIWARVDALSGRIYEFHQYSNEESQKSDLNKEAALAVADRFIKQIEPQLAGQVKLNEPSGAQSPIIPRQEENQSQWYFTYNRLVDNVPFPQQGITITVSSLQKKVIAYSLNWYDYDFPPAERAISATEGNKRFLQVAPLTLCYTRIYQENLKPVMTLVYKPLPSPDQEDFNMIDAISRETLDAAGKPLSQNPGPRSFNDIKGHFAEKEIRLIGQAGLMAEYGQQFQPDKTIDTVTFLKALLGAREGFWSINNVDDARLMVICRERGWIKENIAAGDPLSRDYMVRVLVRSMGLERVVQNSSIFVNPYPDDPGINKGNLGYAALANGLGLVPSSPTFSSDTINRAEVAYALVNSLKP